MIYLILLVLNLLVLVLNVFDVRKITNEEMNIKELCACVNNHESKKKSFSMQQKTKT